MELTGTVEKRDMQAQLLDSNPIERERGITIKLAPVRMTYQGYILNLIDTPGHVDFSYEVSRSLAACEGALLLVDATQGIQAQTLAHYNQAKKLNLKIIPVVNKIDISTADVAASINQIINILGFPESEILLASGKTGQGVGELLTAIIDRIPAPLGVAVAPTRALVFNSSFDPHLGVLAWVRVVDGEISRQSQLYLLATHATTHAIELGFFTPQRHPSDALSAGEVGYIVTNLKDISQLTVGDTLTVLPLSPNLVALPGYYPVKPVVFVSLYPTDGGEIHMLRDALEKLKMEDSALQFVSEFSPALGNGFRVGFLGLLHADVVQERLEREFNLTLIAVAPSVEYEIVKTSGDIIHISKAQDLPDVSEMQEVREPTISASIFVPENFVGPVMQLCQTHRGTMVDMVYKGQLVNLNYLMPLAELIKQFFDALKSATQGFATLDYELIGFEAADLVKLDILIAGERIDSLSQIIARSQAQAISKSLVENLKEIIPRQNFEVAIQAAIGGKVLARSDVKAFRKDVLAKMSGGDQTRKDKLLKKQKKGKARMKRVGKIDLPQEAFLSILKAD